MVQVLLTSFVTKQQPVRLGGGGGAGQCFRRDWKARLLSTVAGLITRMGLVTFGYFFLGLDRIHRLTTMKNKLREDLMAFK